MAKSDISIDTLRELISYCPETGELRWKHRKEYFFKKPEASKSWNVRHAGKIALACQKGGGYLHGDIFNSHYMAHRVAYAIHYGRWPQGHIDHINGIPSDNRICNIREVTAHQNSRNRPLSSRDNNKRPTSIKGIRRNKAETRWQAGFYVNRVYVGTSGHVCFGKAAKSLAFLNKLYGCDFTLQPRQLEYRCF